MRMTSLSEIEPSKIDQVTLGEPLGRSWLWLFGFIPIGYSDLTLVKLDPGAGFLEISPMFSMRSWEHERRIETINSGSRVRDVLNFEPRFSPKLTCLFINLLFKHRHKKLAKYLNLP